MSLEKTLSSLEELAKSATPGPWRLNKIHQPRSVMSEEFGGVVTTGTYNARPNERRSEDARFISSANPTTILKLTEALGIAVDGMRTDIERGGEVTGPLYHKNIREALSKINKMFEETNKEKT